MQKFTLVKYCLAIATALILWGGSYVDSVAQFLNASDICGRTSGLTLVPVNGRKTPKRARQEVLQTTSNVPLDNILFRLGANAQLVIDESDVRFTNIRIECPATPVPTQDGLIVGMNEQGVRVTVDGLQARNMCIRGCGNVGLRILGGTNHKFARFDLKGSGQEGMIAEEVTNSEFIGFTSGLGSNNVRGVVLRNGSHHNRIATALIMKPQNPQAPALTLDPTSTYNQIVRIRLWGNQPQILCNTPDTNLFVDNMCPGSINLTGSCGCGPGYVINGVEQIVYTQSMRTAYGSRPWTVCLDNTSYRPPGESQPNRQCRQSDVKNVFADSGYQQGDLVVVDSYPNEPGYWPSDSFDNASGPTSVIGNTISQNGRFLFDVKFNTVPVANGPFQTSGTDLQNFSYMAPASYIQLPPADGEQINVCSPVGCANNYVP